MLLCLGFKKKKWYADRQNPAQMWRSDFTRHSTPKGCALHGISHWLLPGGELIFTWSWLVDTMKKRLFACCVSDSHHHTRWEVVLGSDDSSFMAVWDSPIWGPWHHPYLQLGGEWQEGSPSKQAVGPWGFLWELVRCGTGVDMGVAGAKSLGESFGGISGHPSACQQMRTELTQGLFGAL